MTTDAVQKFPRTPHLLWIDGHPPRNDKVLSATEAATFLQNPVVVEEKVDGANLGFSVGPDGRLRAQSRANYLNPSRCHTQWKPLWSWLAERESSVIDALGTDLILFGEWCYARHTLGYDLLPDWFLGFDILERQSGLFWSTLRRNRFLGDLGLFSAPEIRRGKVTLKDLPKFIGRSAIGIGPAEGIYLRIEDEFHLRQRAKIVGEAFRSRVEQAWTRKALVPNALALIRQR